MKKVSAFFMALLPFLVVVLLFISGLLAKDFGQKTVQRIELLQKSLVIQKKEDSALVDSQLVGQVNVFPAAATDPTVFYTSSDENIATVEKTTGKMTINGYGHFTIHAVAKQNISAKDSCKVEVWDDKIHQIIVTNSKQAEFMSQNSQLQLEVKTIPEERVKDKRIGFKLVDTQDPAITISQTGLITIGATNSTSNFKVQVYSIQRPEISTTVDVTIGQSIDTIGFKTEGNLVLNNDSYNLYEQVLTYPYVDTSKKLKPSYFTFESSNPDMATIDANGVVKFTKNYVPGTFVDFTVKFAGLSSISCTKRIASSMNLYSDVAFNKYSCLVKLSSSEQEITDIKWSAYPVAEGKTASATLISSNPAVVEVKNGKFYAKSEGKATLKVSVPSGTSTPLTDTCEVTVIKSDSKILKEHSVSLGSNHYYALRKALNPAFENVDIKWTATDTDVATLYDATDGIVVFKKNGEFKVSVEDTVLGLKDEIIIKCDTDTVKTISVEDYGEYTIAVGDKVEFKNGDTVVEPDFGEAASKFIKLNDKKYVAAAGTQAQISATAGDISFSLVTTEPVISFITPNNWSNYITNKKQVNVAETIKMYPSTATIDDYWSSYKPAVSYSYTIEDESAVSVESNVLNYTKIATVKINATVNDITKEYTIKSFAGGNGKFSLKDGTSNASYQSGCTITLSPSEVKTLTIDNYEVSDVDAASLKDSFTITQVNGDDSIVQVAEPVISGNKLNFTFTAMNGGVDTVKISNRSFTFVINFKVDNTHISDINLYSVGNWVSTQSTETNPIDVYTINSLLLNIDINPLNARDEKIKVNFNGTEWETAGTLDLSNGVLGTWKTGVNKLTLSSQDGKIVKTYYLNNMDGQSPGDNFIIEEALRDNGIYLRADSHYVTMTIRLINGIANQDFYNQDNFKCLANGEQFGNHFGKYIIAQITDATKEHPEYDKEITINDVKYNISRDIVSKITFPNNNLVDDEEKCGLQRVKVWGDYFINGDGNLSDTYSMDVNLYDYVGEEIKDLAKKNAAMKTVNLMSNAANAVYNEKTGKIDVKFDHNNLYTPREIANNAFVNGTKSQYVLAGTNYGFSTLDTAAICEYAFNVVKGYNIDTEAGWKKAVAGVISSKNIVLQNDFGTDTPGAAKLGQSQWLAINTLYGNGHTICFDEMTKKVKETGQANHLVTKYALNVEISGCLDDTYQTLKGEKNCMTLTTDGGATKEVEQTFAYCKIKNFYEVYSGWTAESETVQRWTRFKNCLFSNDYEHTNVCIESQNPCTNVVIEDCAFFNAGKVCMQVTNGGNIYFKGNVWVYNFHGSDIFDCFGFDTPTCEWLWSIVLPIAEKAGVIQKEQYGATKPVLNAYLVTLLSNVYFYTGTDAQGKEVWSKDAQGSEKAANYLKRAVSIGIKSLGLNAEFWCTINPPLPLKDDHAPCFSDEFTKEKTPGGETILVFNTATRNRLINLITRH